MSTIKNYREQYAFAKKAAIKAINSGQNVVLWGSGANGKTHLMNELNDFIECNDYAMLGEPSKGDTNYISETMDYLDKENWILAMNNLEHLQCSLKNNAFVLINMSQFKYPKYAKLRSGRA